MKWPTAPIFSMTLAVILFLPSLRSFGQGTPKENRGGRDVADEVTVTLKDVNLDEAIREFRDFQKKLEQYRAKVAEGQATAVDFASTISELRRTAGPENDFNEKPILAAMERYVNDVLVRKAKLIDFLESQRYRIPYYANMLAASVRPEPVTVLFGSRAQNEESIRRATGRLSQTQQEVRQFLERLAKNGEFDLQTFRPIPGISRENRRRLSQLEIRYQMARNAFDLSKSRLRIVEQATRASERRSGGRELNADLILAQMFGALDRVKLQMNSDLLQLEGLLGLYERSARVKDVMLAFEQLLSTQGGIEEPSRGLPSILEWLQESSATRLELGPGGALTALEGRTLTSTPELLEEAYRKAGGSGSTVNPMEGP